MIIDSIIDVIGSIPLIRLNRISSGNVFVKAEFLNPGGSIKDRVASFIIERAFTDGRLKPGMVIIEATSGNTGIGLSLVGVQYFRDTVMVLDFERNLMWVKNSKTDD